MQPKIHSLYRKVHGLAFGGSGASVSRGMLTLVLGSSVARLIGVVTIPLITRLYTPADFGVFSVFTALISSLSPISTLLYSMAITIIRRDGMAINALALCSLLTAVTSVIIALVLFVFGPLILPLISMDKLIPYWWLVGIGLFGASCYDVLCMWATRRKTFRVITTTTLVQSITGVLAKIIMGLLHIQPLGLLVGEVVGRSNGTGQLIRQMRKDLAALLPSVSWKRIRHVAVVFKKLPMLRLPSQFLLIMSQQAPLFAVAAMFDAAAAGQVGLANAALALPVSLISGSMGRAYYAEISALGRKRGLEILAVTKSVLMQLLLLCSVPTLVIFFFGEQIFSLAFGPKWATAGLMATALVPAVATQFLSQPLSQVLSVFGREGIYLYVNTQRVILVLGAFLLCYLLDLGLFYTMLLYSIAISIHRLLFIFTMVRVIRENR
jgi:O-antigen/teichoic acid export membrane protein